MLQADMSSLESNACELTLRQQEVLEQALELLLEGGEKALTTAAIARASNCSKESLYKWFGDRNGLLSAMMAFQGSKVGAGFSEEIFITRASFINHLTEFAVDLLNVLSGDLSIALNRLAIGQASNEGSPLGHLLMKNGRGAIEAKAVSFLNTAHERGYLHFDNAHEAYHVLYGLIVRDMHVRLLLGEPRGHRSIKQQAQLAIGQFNQLYGSDGS